METAIDRKTIWNEGARAGLVFGAIAIAYSVITIFTGKLNGSGAAGVAFLITLMNLILWLGKFLGCIFLMKALMRNLTARYSGVTNQDTFRYGVVTALLSALLYSAFSLALALFIKPDLLTEAFDTAVSSYSSMMDSNALDSIDKIRDSLPQIIFFTNLIYCFLFGTVLSAILSRNIPSRNPFVDDTPAA